MGDTGVPDFQARVLTELADLSPLKAISVVKHTTTDAGLIVAVDLDTRQFLKADGGLPVNPVERLYLVVSPAYPWVPPQVGVDHDRWTGYPHVLQGSRLCLYLDPATEWNPLGGMRAHLQRLWDWFADAIANRFDPATALYHPVGGVFHRTDGAPTLVVANSFRGIADGFQVSEIHLRQRSAHRLDLIASHGEGTLPDDAVRGVLVVLSDSMPHGGGHHVSDLAVTIRGQDSRNQRKQFLAAVTKTARSLKTDQHLHVVVAVPNRHLTGDARFHLVGWRLAQPLVAKAVEITKQRHKAHSPHPEDEPQVEWTYIDDGRTGVTTRRDHARPISWFAGKDVELWGCGALGSWIAEYLVRAGVSSIVLRDPGYVTTGLLVRQNYTELDVGRPKVDALADRLRAVSDRVAVVAERGLAQVALLGEGKPDVIIDCTVNTGVAVAIDQRQTAADLPVPIVQVATDNHTATLGILTVTTGDCGRTTNDVDKAIRDVAERDPSLSPYRIFWSHDDHPPLTPAVGCSVPTFHGSISDASAVAAAAVSLAATALGRGLAGGYLYAAAHSPHDVPRNVAVPVPDAVGADRLVEAKEPDH